MDDLDFVNEEVLRLNWRKWLALFNQQQMLQGVLLVTRSAMDAGDCAGWLPAVNTHSHSGASSPEQLLLAKEWDDAISQTLEPLRQGLRQLAALQATPPAVGYELANDRGNVVAEAEMAWPDNFLVLLTADQEDLAVEWLNAGWTALILSVDCLQVASEPWVHAVASKLNIEINPAQETL